MGFPVPMMTSPIDFNDTELHFVFPTVAGQKYQVEFTDGLMPVSWSPIGDVIIGTGNPITVTNFYGPPERYFRLQVAP